MYQVYRRIPQMTPEELIFWIKRCDHLHGPWADKIQNACVLRLHGEKFDDHSPAEIKNPQVEIGWKVGKVPKIDP